MGLGVPTKSRNHWRLRKILPLAPTFIHMLTWDSRRDDQDDCIFL
ncbi:unnamed protein product [Brassica oleracea var. botrytis]